MAGADSHLGETTVQVSDICDSLVGLCVHPLQTSEDRACQLATIIAEKLHSRTFLVEYGESRYKLHTLHCKCVIVAYSYYVTILVCSFYL